VLILSFTGFDPSLRRRPVFAVMHNTALNVREATDKRLIWGWTCLGTSCQASEAPQSILQATTMEQNAMIARSLLLLPFCFSAADAFGQTAKELVGSWTLISVTVNRDGEKVEPFGPNPKGTMTFDSGGRFSIIVTRSDLPKFASNNRETATSEENKAVVQGSIAYFGT
jgi:Lipocalin-like domain